MNTRKSATLKALGASLVVASGAIGLSNLVPASADASPVTTGDEAQQVAQPTPMPAPFGGRGGRGGRGGGGDHHLQGMNTNPPAVELAPSQDEVEPTQSIELAPGAEYYDGQYYGDAVQAGRWRTMQVVAVIENGELVDILIADYPRSTYESDIITRNALPTLISEAIEVQDADVDFVSRATDSSRAFVQSLESALLDAAIGVDL